MAGLRNQHAFDMLPVLQTEEILSRTVSRTLNLIHLESAYKQSFGKKTSEVFGEIRHVREGIDATVIDPPEDLAGAIGSNAVLFQPAGQGFLGEAF